MHVAWINECGGSVGGCERYVLETSRLLAERGFRSTLFFDPRQGADGSYLDAFDAAFPLIEPATQLEAAAPDLVYLHRWSDEGVVEQLLECDLPTIRFFHDHRLFCLREHKYTAIGQKTCQQAVGLGCYRCLGFVNRSESWPGIRLSRVGRLVDEQALNKRLDGFVVASGYMVDHLSTHGFDRERIHKIPLFATPPDSGDSLSRESDLLLFVGALTTGKGLDVLLEAMSRLERSAKLVVAGDGPQAADYREQAAKLGLAGRVEFLGRVRPEDVDRLYRRALALVLPARSPETFALVGPEAMSRGAAVVATDIGGVREWLVPDVNGLVVPSGVPEALATALDGLLDDPEKAISMGLSGAQMYAQRFLPHHHVDALEALMEEVVN